MIYFIVFAFIVFLFGVGQHYKLKPLILFSLALLVLFAGLRYNVGRDFQSYKVIFLTILNGKTEIGFRLLNLIVLLSGFNFQVVFLISSFITIILVYKTIIKISPYITLSLFLFLSLGFLLESFNIIRQWIAISIFFYASIFIVQKKFFPYFLLILIAALFHKSALISIPFYFLGNVSFNRYTLIILLIFSIIFSFFINLHELMLNTPFYSNYFQKGNELVSADLGLGYVSKLLIGIFVILFYSEIVAQGNFARMSVNFFFFYLITLAVFRDSQVLVRIGYYFHIFLIVVIPFIIKAAEKRTKLILLFSFIVFSLAILTISIINPEEKFLPYSFNLDFVSRKIK